MPTPIERPTWAYISNTDLEPGSDTESQPCYLVTQPEQPVNRTALRFDRTLSQRVEIDDHDAYRIRNGLTVAMWVRKDATYAADEGIAGDRSGWFMFTTQSGGDRWGAAMYLGGWRYLYAPITTFNEWTHLMATYDGTNMKLWVNFVEVASATYAGQVVGNSPYKTYLGYDYNRGYSTIDIASFDMWNYALDAGERAALDIPLYRTSTLHSYLNAVDLPTVTTDSTQGFIVSYATGANPYWQIASQPAVISPDAVDSRKNAYLNGGVDTTETHDLRIDVNNKYTLQNDLVINVKGTANFFIPFSLGKIRYPITRYADAEPVFFSPSNPGKIRAGTLAHVHGGYEMSSDQVAYISGENRVGSSLRSYLVADTGSFTLSKSAYISNSQVVSSVGAYMNGEDFAIRVQDYQRAMIVSFPSPMSDSLPAYVDSHGVAQDGQLVFLHSTPSIGDVQNAYIQSTVSPFYTSILAVINGNLSIGSDVGAFIEGIYKSTDNQNAYITAIPKIEDSQPCYINIGAPHVGFADLMVHGFDVATDTTTAYIHAELSLLDNDQNAYIAGWSKQESENQLCYVPGEVAVTISDNQPSFLNGAGVTSSQGAYINHLYADDSQLAFIGCAGSETASHVAFISAELNVSDNTSCFIRA